MLEATPTGVLVLRVWTEQGDDHLRGRITQTLDIDDPATESTLVAGSEGIAQVVVAFLRAFADQDGPVTRW